jgi:hypothetical protein
MQMADEKNCPADNVGQVGNAITARLQPDRDVLAALCCNKRLFFDEGLQRDSPCRPRMN